MEAYKWGTKKNYLFWYTHNKKLYQIADILVFDPRSISREVKRNRILVDFPDGTKRNCDKLKRWPYVCSNCNNRYNKNCPFVKID